MTGHHGVKGVLEKMVRGKEMLSCMCQQEPTGCDFERVKKIRHSQVDLEKPRNKCYHLSTESGLGYLVPGQALCSGTVSCAAWGNSFSLSGPQFHQLNKMKAEECVRVFPAPPAFLLHVQHRKDKAEDCRPVTFSAQRKNAPCFVSSFSRAPQAPSQQH